MGSALIKIFIYCIVVCVLVGCMGAFFNMGLKWAQLIFDRYPVLIALLPLAGVVTVWAYQRADKTTRMGTFQLVENYVDGKNTTTSQMPIYIVFFTWVTHLFGGSAGREGTALQMGGGLSAWIQRHHFFKEIPIRWAILLGLAGGFSAVFGTPCAALIFAIELVSFRFVKMYWMIGLLGVAVGADLVAQFVGPPHTYYQPEILEEVGSWDGLVAASIFGFFLGGAAFLFLILMDWLQHLKVALGINSYVWVILFSSLVACIIWWSDGWQYAGLGVGQIERIMTSEATWYDAVMKFFLTLGTLGAGLKGGEVTPLFFIGSHFGNWLSSYLPASLGLCTAVGFVAMYAGASKAPIACAVMGMEVFGWQYGIYFLIACLVASAVSGRKGLYDLERDPSLK